MRTSTNMRTRQARSASAQRYPRATRGQHRSRRAELDRILTSRVRRRRGYELTRWMPALTGVIVGSAEQSDRFLYDFRRTLAELIADHHYGQIAATARARGLINYSEALERDRPVLGDDMEMRRHATVPMAAMWTYSPRQARRPRLDSPTFEARPRSLIYTGRIWSRRSRSRPRLRRGLMRHAT